MEYAVISKIDNGPLCSLAHRARKMVSLNWNVSSEYTILSVKQKQNHTHAHYCDADSLPISTILSSGLPTVSKMTEVHPVGKLTVLNLFFESVSSAVTLPLRCSNSSGLRVYSEPWKYFKLTIVRQGPFSSCCGAFNHAACLALADGVSQPLVNT